MGHAMHTWHSCKYQPVNTAEYVIFVAEVASTCNEILLIFAVHAALLEHFVDEGGLAVVDVGDDGYIAKFFILHR